MCPRGQGRPRGLHLCHLSPQRDEERLAATLSRAVSMRYKTCKVNSFSQEFPKIFLYKHT